jgi:glycerophosphoryl diester phosphodiesterase
MGTPSEKTQQPVPKIQAQIPAVGRQGVTVAAPSMVGDGEQITQLQGVAAIANTSVHTQVLTTYQAIADQGPQSQYIVQLQALANGDRTAPTIPQTGNTAGLPAQLKSGIENLSGLAMDDVQVHYNSNKPAQLQAHAFAQNSDIHLGSGQERHLPHEAWHVVQQKQGRVKPTLQCKGIKINDDDALEREADMMGAKALTAGFGRHLAKVQATSAADAPHQRMRSATVWSPGGIVQAKFRRNGRLMRVSEVLAELLAEDAPPPVEASGATAATAAAASSSIVNVSTASTVTPTAPPSVAAASNSTPQAPLSAPVFAAASAGAPSTVAIDSKAETMTPSLLSVPSGEEDGDGRMSMENLRKAIKKLAEGPDIVTTSAADLRIKWVLLMRSYGTMIFANKGRLDANWRKINRIAGLMEAKLRVFAMNDQPDDSHNSLYELTFATISLSARPSAAAAVEVLGRAVRTLGSYKTRIRQHGARWMWRIFDLLSEMGPLAHTLCTTFPAKGALRMLSTIINGLLRDMRQLMATNLDNITVVAHRGHGPTNRTMGKLIDQRDNRRIHRPAENSPEAFSAALNQARPRGLDGVECDVFLSSDNVPILSHETNVMEQLATARQQTLEADEVKRTAASASASNLSAPASSVAPAREHVHHFTAREITALQRTASRRSRFMTLRELLEGLVTVAEAYYTVTGKPFRVEIEMKGRGLHGYPDPMRNRPAVLAQQVSQVVSKFYKRHPGIPVEIVMFNGEIEDVKTFANMRSRKTALGDLYSGINAGSLLGTAALATPAFMAVVDELRYMFSSESKAEQDAGDHRPLPHAAANLANYLVTLVYGQEFPPAEIGEDNMAPSMKLVSDSRRPNRNADQVAESALARFASNPLTSALIRKLHVLTDYPKKAAWLKRLIQQALLAPAPLALADIVVEDEAKDIDADRQTAVDEPANRGRRGRGGGGDRGGGGHHRHVAAAAAAAQPMAEPDADQVHAPAERGRDRGGRRGRGGRGKRGGRGRRGDLE